VNRVCESAEASVVVSTFLLNVDVVVEVALTDAVTTQTETSVDERQEKLAAWLLVDLGRNKTLVLKRTGHASNFKNK
jgi:hypothetical protein